MIELSVPGGEPWLDGAPMQIHHKQSRDNGVDARRAFDLGKQVRKHYPDLPILPMAYHAAVVSLGVDRFVDLAAEADVDGVELPDYPTYSAQDPHAFHTKLRKVGIYNINFCDGISLASKDTRQYDLLYAIATDVDGFLFLTATPGVTGGQGEVAVRHLAQAVKRIREIQLDAGRSRPVLVGFGLSTSENVRQVVQEVRADAIVVGSAVSRLINQGDSPELIKKFIASLKHATLRNVQGKEGLESTTS